MTDKMHSSMAGLLLTTLLLSGCTSPLPSTVVANRAYIKTEGVAVRLPPWEGESQTELSLEFLGVGGFAIEAGNRKIITAPSYTNPPLLGVLANAPIKPDEGKIDSEFPPNLWDENNPDSSKVEAVIVGHSHYDHLLDVPYLMDKQIRSSIAYGSPTMAAILNNKEIPCEPTDGAPPRAISLKEKVGKEWQRIGPMGQGQFRILAVKSEHAPHIGGYTALTGFRRCPDSFEVDSVWDWVMGEVYAYLIDYLERDSTGKEVVVYRIYYQDSAGDLTFDKACDGPGLPSCEQHCKTFNDNSTTTECALWARDIDIAIVTLAGANNASEDYPKQLVSSTDADLFVIGHWEDFFGNHGETPVVARRSDAKAFIENLDETIPAGAQWVLPYPSRKIVVKRGTN